MGGTWDPGAGGLNGRARSEGREEGLARRPEDDKDVSKGSWGACSRGEAYEERGRGGWKDGRAEMAKAGNREAV